MDSRIILDKITISPHVGQRCADRGFTLAAVWAALRDPEIVYAANPDRYGDQIRVIRDGMVVCLDVPTQRVRTVFFHGRTDYRP